MTMCMAVIKKRKKNPKHGEWGGWVRGMETVGEI